MYWYLREARLGKGKMNNFVVMYYVTILKLIWNIVNLTNWKKIENSTVTTLKIFFAKNKYQIRNSLYCLKTVDCCTETVLKGIWQGKITLFLENLGCWSSVTSDCLKHHLNWRDLSESSDEFYGRRVLVWSVCDLVMEGAEVESSSLVAFLKWSTWSCL